MMQKKYDDAVSPVIGVMLMIVITVVIAGVIAAFGTGMVTDMEPAPNVVLDVEIINYDKQLDGMTYRDLSGPDFRITHISGDTLDTGDIELQFSWSFEGTKYHSSYSANSIEGQQPMYIETASDWDIPFGEAELEPGYTIHTRVKHLGSITEDSGQHIGSRYMDQIFNNGDVIAEDSLAQKGIMEFLEKGTKVDVIILHIPSNSIIYNKEVYVK